MPATPWYRRVSVAPFESPSFGLTPAVGDPAVTLTTDPGPKEPSQTVVGGRDYAAPPEDDDEKQAEPKGDYTWWIVGGLGAATVVGIGIAVAVASKPKPRRRRKKRKKAS